VVENIEEVSKAIHVPAIYPTQFFGYELSVSARFQEKTKEGGRTCAVLAGIHSAALLEKVMTKFELLYVVCPNCKDGGTRLSVSKKNGVRIKCGACGKISNPRSVNKLEKFMVKNPPPKQQSGLEIGANAAQSKSELGAIGSVGGLESVLGGQSPSKKESKAKSKAKKKKEVKEEPEAVEDQKELDHKEEPEEPQRQATPREKFLEFIKSLRTEEGKSFDELQIVALCSELDRLALVHSLSKPDRLKLSLSGLIDTSLAPKTLPSQFSALRSVFLKLAPDRHAKLTFIAAILHILVTPPEGLEDQKSNKPQSLLSYLPMILMALYESEVLSEDDILAWMGSPPDLDTWAVSREVAVKAKKVSKELAEWLEAEDE